MYNLVGVGMGLDPSSLDHLVGQNEKSGRDWHVKRSPGSAML